MLTILTILCILFEQLLVYGVQLQNIGKTKYYLYLLGYEHILISQHKLIEYMLYNLFGESY